MDFTAVWQYQKAIALQGLAYLGHRLALPLWKVLIGAAFFLAFRDVLSDYTEHWMLFFGPLIVLRVLLVEDGLWGMVMRLTRRRPPGARSAGEVAGPAEPQAGIGA